MNQEWLDCLMKLPLEDYEQFINHTKLDMNLQLSKKYNPKDYSWLNVVERYLPFLKSAIESPYQLLVEEDLKKNYESRFLYTLFLRLLDFLERQLEIIFEQEQESLESHLSLKGTTSLEDKEVSFELSLQVNQQSSDKKNSKGSIKNRLEQALNYLEPLKKSEFMNHMQGASCIRFPLRRSLLSTESEVYRKLLELFEFLESYATLENAFVITEKKREKEEFLIPYFMNYALFFEPNLFKDTNIEFLKKYLDGFIKQFVSESSIDEKDFKKMMNKLFEEKYAKKKNREKNISEIFVHSFDSHQKQVKDAIRSFRT